MSVLYRFDVAVVGGGIAGLMTGVRLAELGVGAAVLEKGECERYPCNTRYSGGVLHVGMHSVNDDHMVLAEVISERTQGFASADVTQALATDARTAVQWLKAKGIKFIKGPDPWHENVLAPPPLLKPGLHWEGRGGDVLLRTLAGILKELGGALLLGTRARRLRMDDRRCTGLEVEQQDKVAEVQADSVVICDGGFQANHALLREFVCTTPAKLKQRGAATGNGDGLQMAREVGAKLVGMESIYGHLLAQDAMHNDSLWPEPEVDPVCRAGIVIDTTGRRFMDEGLGGLYMTNCIARLQDPLSTTVIYDETIWNGPARDYIIPANPNLVAAGANIVKANDFSGLAKQLGLPVGILQDTAAKYNASVDTGQTAHLAPPRSTSTYKAYPIRQPPFYALRLCAGITYTMGGLATDGTGRVLDAQNRPIPGLYAAGCATGGLEGGAVPGYVGGLAKSSTFALRVANHIAANRANRKSYTISE